jgi:hypothetical protein
MKLNLFTVYCLLFACQFRLAQTTCIKDFDNLTGALNTVEQVRIICYINDGNNGEGINLY